MTGFDVAQKLRQQYQDLPALVALTANVVNDKTEYLAKGMDEVLNKPLSVKAITNVIENLVLSCSHEIQATDVDDDGLESTNIAQTNVIDTLLDLEMLISYVEIVGTEPVYTSIEMFEKMMPDYLAILDSNMTAKDQDGIKFEAHKIKGAAGSIGLKHIQQVAQKAQSPELPAWWENINDWVDEIKYSYQDDINVLKTWLKQQ